MAINKPVASQPDATEPDAAVSSLADVGKSAKKTVDGSGASGKLKSCCKRWYSRISACNSHRFFVSLWSSFSFIGMVSQQCMFGLRVCQSNTLTSVQKVLIRNLYDIHVLQQGAYVPCWSVYNQDQNQPSNQSPFWEPTSISFSTSLTLLCYLA